MLDKDDNITDNNWQKTFTAHYLHNIILHNFK